MTRSLQEANQEISRVRSMPYGIAHTQAAEHQMKVVESEGPDEAKAYALFVLIDSYQWGGEPERGLVPFAQMLRWWDQRPETFDETDRHSLFWTFKWMISGLTDFPQVPAEQIDRTLADMDRRYRIAGNGLDAVAFERFAWARRRGLPETEQRFQEWVATPRDDFSQCASCDPGDRAGYLLATGRTEEGIRLIEQTLTENPKCASEPADMLADLADAYLDQGRAEDAVRTHRRAVAELEHTLSNMAGARARRIRLLARGGQPKRAIHALESEQHLLTETETPYESLVFARVVGSATHVMRSTHGEQPVRLTAVPATTVAELDDWLRARAEDLAGQFDRRNGTTRETDAVVEAWSTEPAGVTLELDVLPRALGTTPVGVPVPGVAKPADQGAATDSPPESVAVRAEQLSTAGDLPAAATAWVAAAQEAEAAGMLIDAGFALAEAAHAAQELGDQLGASGGYRAAAARLQAGGVEPTVLVQVLLAWAPAAADAGESDVAIAEISRCLDQLADGGEDANLSERLAKREQIERRRAIADLHDVTARLMADAEDPERQATAAAAAQSAAESFGGLGLVVDAAHSFWLAGRVYDQLGRVDEAVWNLESAMEGFHAAHRRDSYGEVANLLVDVLRRSGQVARAEDLARTIAS